MSAREFYYVLDGHQPMAGVELQSEGGLVPEGRRDDLVAALGWRGAKRD